MRTGITLFITIFIVFLMTMQSVAVEHPDDLYEQIKVKSQSDGISPEGEVYLKKLDKDFKELINNAFSQCLKGGIFSRPRLFNLVLRLDAKGLIEQVVASEANDASKCVNEHLKGKPMPVPPFAPFHVLVDVVPERKK